MTASALDLGTRPTILLAGSEIDLSTIASIAAGRVRFRVSDEALARVMEGRSAFMDALASGQPIYGSTTGVGAMKDRAHYGAEVAEFSRALPYAHQFAVGEEMPDEVARVMIALRLNTLLSGQVGGSVEMVRFLEAMLNHDLLPLLHRRGSAGCADLGQMGELATVMVGEGTARLAGQTMPAAEALARIGLAPHPMPPRDGLALTATNSYGLAKAALDLIRAAWGLRRAMAVAALGAQALGVDRRVWDGVLVAGLPHEKRIVRWLIEATADAPDWPRRQRVHDPLSARMLAQIFGASLGAIEEAAQTVRVETAHVDDNPLVLGGRIVTSGGSLLMVLSMRLGALQLALAHLGRNSFNRCLLMTGGQMEGLPVNLVPRDVVATGYGPVMKLALEQSVRMTAASSPVSVLNQTVAGGLEDEAAFISLSAGQVRAQLDAFDWLLAVEAMLAAQALDMQGLATGRLGRLVRGAVRHHIPPFTRDRPQSNPLMALHAEMISSSFNAALVNDFPLEGFDISLGLASDAENDTIAASSRETWE